MGELADVSNGGNTLNNAIVAASALLDPGALANVAVAEVRRLLGVDGASVAFWDEEQHLLVPLAFDDVEVAGPDPVFHPGQGLIGEAFRRGGPVAVTDYAHELDHPAVWATVSSGIAVPLRADGRLVGSISGQTYTRREFGQHDFDLLSVLADQVGPALGTMRLLARAQRRTAEAYALATLLRRGAEVRDVQELFTLVSTTAVRLLGADIAGIVLRTLHEGSAWCGVVGNRTDAWRDRIYAADHPASRTIFSGATQIVRARDNTVFDPSEFPFFAAEGVMAGVSLPLNHGSASASRGALCLGWRFDVELGRGHLELCEALAAFSGSMVVAAATRAERDAIIANAPVLVVALDAEGLITACDGAAAAAIGLGKEQVGRRISEVLTTMPDVLKLVDPAGADAERTTVELRVAGRTLDVVVERGDRGTFLVGTDVTDRCAAEEELHRHSIEDGLTGLPNRARVLERIAESLEREPVSLAIADVRNFDHVNEAVGYEAGDELLRMLGERLAADIGDAIVVGRIGGDEFAVATSGTDVSLLGSRVRKSLEALVAEGTASTLSVDVRCGLASAPGGADASTLAREADSALQIARRGTQPMVVWDAEVARRYRPQLAVARKLRSALERRAFTVAYQPILDVSGGGVRRVEALARWPIGLQPTVAPDVFVPLAERLGRVGQLTAHVLDVALSEVAAGLGVAVSVNISPLDVVHGDLVVLVADRLDAYGLGPDMLMLELTEHAALEAETDVLRSLAASGVALSVDDFGRGWSSLEMLKRVPARDLKLDRSFVEHVAVDETDAAIVRAAVEVGHALGMEVVAEGIEDDVVLEAVRGLGCDLAQGYHLARPMDVAALRSWLEQRPNQQP